MPAARGRRVQTDLALDPARLAELKGRHVPREVEAVGARRGEEVAARVGERADVGAVLRPAVGDVRGDEGVGCVGEDGEVGGRVDEVFAEAVALFHEHVEVVPRRVHGYPSGVISFVWTVHGADELNLGTVPRLAMDPDLVRLQVGRVEIRLCRIKHHAVDAGVGLVLIILHICVECFG